MSEPKPKVPPQTFAEVRAQMQNLDPKPPRPKKKQRSGRDVFGKPYEHWGKSRIAGGGGGSRSKIGAKYGAPRRTMVGKRNLRKKQATPSGDITGISKWLDDRAANYDARIKELPIHQMNRRLWDLEQKELALKEMEIETKLAQFDSGAKMRLPHKLAAIRMKMVRQKMMRHKPGMI